MQTAGGHGSSIQNDWLMRWSASAQPTHRIFCFPFAGGGAYYYRPWSQFLQSNFEVCAVQLPGRENRRAEPPITSMVDLMPQLLNAVKSLMDVPFSFFGHSLGGLIAFELAKYLRRQNSVMPSHLFISATAAPTRPRHTPILHTMSDDQLVKQLIHYGGTPPEVLADKDMMGMVLPLLRADSSLLETCLYVSEKPLDCPISVFGSDDDERVSIDDLRGWEEQTSSIFSMRMFPGGHFFLKDVQQRNLMLEIISSSIAL